MFCIKCGTEIEADEKYCYRCGAPQFTEESAVRKKKVLWPVFLAAALLLIAAVILILVLFSRGAKEREYNDQIKLAERYLDELDYDRAVAAYYTAIEIDPANTEAYLGLAEAYIAMGEYDKAEKILKEGWRETEDEVFKAELEKLEKLIKAGINKDMEEVIPTAEATPAPTATPTEKPRDERWKAAYTADIRSYEAENPVPANAYEWEGNAYDLIYVNDDDIPELVLDHRGYYAEVHSCIDGVSTVIYSFGYGAAGRNGDNYGPRSGYIFGADIDYAGLYIAEWEVYFDGKTTVETSHYMHSQCFVDRNGNDYPDENEITEEWHYFVDNLEVSPEEYASYFEYSGESESISGVYSMDEMLNRLK